MLKLAWAMFGLMLTIPYAALGADIVEKKGRIEINWTTQRLTYFGESTSDNNTEVTYREAEQRAWRDGFSYLETALVEAKAVGMVEDSATSEQWKQLARRIGKATTSINTTYFADGKVRVLLEANVDGSVGKRGNSKESPSSEGQTTGIVFVVSGEAQPTPHLRIELDNGKVVFNTSERTVDGKRFGGYWFRSNARSQLSAVVGKNSVEVAAQAGSDGIIVAAEVWESKVKALRPLLESGRVAILIE